MTYPDVDLIDVALLFVIYDSAGVRWVSALILVLWVIDIRFTRVIA